MNCYREKISKYEASWETRANVGDMAYIETA